MRVLPKSLRRPLKATMFVAFLGCVLMTAGQCQPLKTGVQLESGERFVVDKGTLVGVSAQFGLVKTPKFAGVTYLYQGSSKIWKSSFLIQTESELSRVTQSPGGLEVESLFEGANAQIYPWNEQFLVPSVDRLQVLIIGPKTSTILPLKEKLTTLTVVDSQLVVVETKSGFSTLRSDPASGGTTPGTPILHPLKIPFKVEKAKLTMDFERALLWSPESDRALDLKTGEIVSFNEKPTIGIRILPQGDLVALGSKGMEFVGAQVGRRQFARPTQVDSKSLEDWKIFKNGKSVQVLWQAESRPRGFSFRFAGPTGGQMLAAGRIHALIQPGPQDDNGPPLLFVETSLEEPKLDEHGDQIMDLETRKPATLKVIGYRMLSLDANNNWNVLVDEPRSVLVGPVQRIGSRVLYATQTEPVHIPGQSVAVNHRYPYPAVIVQSRSLSSPTTDHWSYEKPRGETPSKGRLPQGDSTWPVLAGEGPLVLTTEADTLIAIDPKNGEKVWESETLPLDDSSPEMVDWTNGFALIATKDSTRALLMIDPTSGKVVKELALNATFFREKTPHLIALLLICAALGYYIYAAGRRKLYIRKIAGLNALDEAVGRATEMGKPVLYVVGLADVDDIQTLASLSILSHVARRTAEYDTPIVTTTARAVTFSAAQEIVRDAYSVTGRPEAFNVESVRYISDDQFGYTAGVDGIMVREEPAANFYIGKFYGESLILAETGYATGSIQIAGTSEPNQLPFFVAACDYTLIGEELFAASAYLSRDPLQVGSLRGQDVGKAIVMLMLVVGSILISLGFTAEPLAAMLGFSAS